MMLNRLSLSLLLCASTAFATPLEPRKKYGDPFLKTLNDTTHIIGNDIWNVTIGKQYGIKLMYKGVDLVGNAVGHYVSYNGAQSDIAFNASAPTLSRKGDYTDITFYAAEGEFHWVITPELSGAYQYFVNKALPTLGEFRTLWRLDNSSFTKGHTDERDEALPPLSDIAASTKVQDETWQRADGTFITKYDFSTFLPNVEGDLSYWGVYGPLGGASANKGNVGSWYIHGGKDYLNGDQLKQELMVHRESATGDAVQLNMVHGTHFQATSSDVFPVGKTWGPWLWYLNDGSADDAAKQAKAENKAWPYDWYTDSLGFHSRGSLSGRLTLSDGRPAAGAAIFVGDNNPDKTALDQGSWYYYRTYADDNGKFSIDNVREGTYGLQAWANGDKIGDVTTVFMQNDVSTQANKKTDLGKLQWQIQGRKQIFQVGEIDRKATGFAYSGPPHQHARVANCPANLTYTVGKSKDSDWCLGQWALGTWTVGFNLDSIPAGNKSAVLSVSLAGYSSGVSSDILTNGVKVGNLTSASILSDPALYRSGTLAGEWHYYEFPVPAGTLKKGANSVDFKCTRSTTWHGFMWDSVLLEWS